MLGLHVKAVDVVEPAVPCFRHDGKRPPVAGGIGLAVRHSPLNDSVADDADAMRVGDHHGTFEEAGFLDPSRAGHFAVAVLREPAGENSAGHGIFAARKNCRDARADGTFTDLKLSFTGNQRGVADQNTSNVGDGVKRTGRAVKRDSEIAGAGLGGRFFLSVHGEGEKRNTAEEDHELE